MFDNTLYLPSYQVVHHLGEVGVNVLLVVGLAYDSEDVCVLQNGEMESVRALIGNKSYVN